jgi:hypothetical protein
MQSELTFETAPFEGYTEFDEFESGKTAQLLKTSKPVAKGVACRIVPVTVTALNSLKLPPVRACCFLAPTKNPLFPEDNMIDPSTLGKHRTVTTIAGIVTPSEARGIIYTGKAGFLDLGHMRDLCDLTKFVFDQLSSSKGTPEYVRTVHGYARIYKCPPDVIKVARAISFDDSFGYEISSYFKPLKIGYHNSSFSPEDLCSNFLGTLLAETAIEISRRAKVDFNRAVDAALIDLLKKLNALPKNGTKKAFELINNRWVSYDLPSWGSPLFLKRRNFSQTPFKAGHPSDQPTPAFVTTPLPDFSSIYNYVHWEEGQKPIKKNCVSADDMCFAKAISMIKKASERLYGPDFDKP